MARSPHHHRGTDRSNGAAQESNLPSLGLPDLTGFEDGRLAVLLERFALWLEGRSATGDVMAESRGGKEDRRLKEELSRIYTGGTLFVPYASFVALFTSS